MTKRAPVAAKSRTYKGVRNFNVKAALRGDTVEVTLKLGRYELDISPIIVSVSEWTKRRSANPYYDKWEYLNSRYNKNGYPQTGNLLDEVRKAVDEVTGDEQNGWLVECAANSLKLLVERSKP